MPLLDTAPALPIGMDKHLFSFQDENLSTERAARGALHLIVGVDGLSVLASSAENQLLGLTAVQNTEKKAEHQYFEADLQGILREQRLLAYSFGTVRAGIFVPMATLVPNRLFSPQDCSKYFQLLQPGKQEMIYGYEELSGFDCHLVWAAPQQFQYFTNRYQPRHLAGILIRSFHTLASANGYSIFLNIRGHYAQITVFEQRRLVFYNTFEFNKPADLLYFVLLVFDQFRLNPEQVPLHVSGALLKDSDHYNILYKYIRNLEFLTPKKPAGLLPKGENTLPDHFWFDLLSL